MPGFRSDLDHWHFCSGPLAATPGLRRRRRRRPTCKHASKRWRPEFVSSSSDWLQPAGCRATAQAAAHVLPPVAERCVPAGRLGGHEQLACPAAADPRSSRIARSSSSISRYASSAANSSSTESRPPSARKPLQRWAPAARGLRCAPPMAPSSCGCAGTCNPTGGSTRTTMGSRAPTHSCCGESGPSSRARSSKTSTSASCPTSAAARRCCRTRTSISASLRRVKIRAGKFKTPFGLERLVSATDLLFVERALPTSVAPNRDAGVLLFGDVLDARLNYSVGVVNGVSMARARDADDRDGKDAVARLFALPFKASRHERLRGLGIGVAGTSGTQRGTLRRAEPAGVQDQRPDRVRPVPARRHGGRHDVRRTGRTGACHRRATTTRARSGCWRNTCSRRSVSAGHRDGASRHPGVAGRDVVRAHRRRQFVPRGDAPQRVRPVFRLVGRGRGHRPRRTGSRSTMDAFPSFANPAIAARDARGWAVGANWYLNRAVKVTADYEETYFRGGAASGDRETERDLFTRIQVGF